MQNEDLPKLNPIKSIERNAVIDAAFVARKEKLEVIFELHRVDAETRKKIYAVLQSALEKAFDEEGVRTEEGLRLTGFKAVFEYIRDERSLPIDAEALISDLSFGRKR